jgi:hypothetical protein
MNIPTTEEILIQEGMHSLHIMKEILTADGRDGSQGERLINAMISFTKLHVQAALKEAAENVWVPASCAGSIEVVRDTILNSYSLDNIK